MVKKIWYVFFSLFIVIIDQIVKYLIVALNPSIEILSYFSIVFIKNQGAAFGILKGLGWLFVVVAFVVLVFMGHYYRKIDSKQILLLSAWSLFIGGLLGNSIDRIFRGYVVDFISIGSFPTFNIADSCLSIGLVLFVIAFWKVE